MIKTAAMSIIRSLKMMEKPLSHITEQYVHVQVVNVITGEYVGNVIEKI